jgi:hypothetical protein
MKWAALQVAVLVLALAASNAACAMTCSVQPCHDHSSAPPCHQKHNVEVCDHVLPVADVVAAAAPAPSLMAVVMVCAPLDQARGDWSLAISPRLVSIPILRI